MAKRKTEPEETELRKRLTAVKKKASPPNWKRFCGDMNRVAAALEKRPSMLA